MVPLLHLKRLRISPTFCHQEPLPDDEAEQRELYEVYALVYIIEQPDVGRHLVSCIKVSEPYHQRKERVTCTQWYLFNDFCIEPIEKVHKQICDEKSNVTVEPLFQSHPEKLGKGGRNRRVGVRESPAHGQRCSYMGTGNSKISLKKWS